MVIIQSFKQRPVCEECQKRSLSGKIENPKFKKLFDIDPCFYEQSNFLRDIRYQYSLYHNLTEKQVNAFKKVVHEFKNPKKVESKQQVPNILPKKQSGLMRSERSVLRALRTK